MNPGAVVAFARKAFPVTVAFTFLLALFLYFVYSIAMDDYGMICPGPPVDPRCVTDLAFANRIKFLGVFCLSLAAVGGLLELRTKGAFKVAALAVLSILVAYTLVLLLGRG